MAKHSVWVGGNNHSVIVHDGSGTIIRSKTTLHRYAHEQNYSMAVIRRSRGGLSANKKEEKMHRVITEFSKSRPRSNGKRIFAGAIIVAFSNPDELRIELNCVKFSQLSTYLLKTTYLLTLSYL